MLINADLGEGCGNDAAIMPFIDLASIACGGHAGDTETMRNAVSLCKKHAVKVGAHPSYVDRDNFGRASQLAEKNAESIVGDCINQVSQLAQICQRANSTLHYIKPHGALYHDLADDTELADLFVERLLQAMPHLFLVGPPDSALQQSAEQAGTTYLAESFADRRYADNGKLVARSERALAPVLEDLNEVKNQVRMLQAGSIKTLSGNIIPLATQTLCIHGDTSSAVAIAKVVRETLSP